jgi:signal transduction histidine kinase
VSRRLLLSYLSLAALVLVVLEIPLGITFSRNERADLTSKVERDAVAIASLAEGTLEASPAERRPRQVAAIARRYADATGGRVVIVDRRGLSLVDTSPPAPGPRDFSTRPEIARALGGGIATGTRRSKTLGTRLLYVAVPAASSGVVHGAVRITYPTSTVDARVRRYWLILAAVAGVVLAATAALGLTLARSVARPLRELQRAAGDAGAGNLAVRAREDAGPEEVRALGRDFNDMVSQLDALLRSHEAFVADASHQLRTPLTALRLRLENLQRDVAPEGLGELEGALTELERLGRLVDGLLALARADAGTGAAVDVDLGAAVRERVDAWSALADEREVRLAVEPLDGLRVHVGADRLEQVLDNLLANALEVSPPRGTITLAAAPADGLVELHVADEGPGLPPEQREQAFARFWRGGEGGSGLGLAIVRRLVSSDGGQVELREAPGGGLDAVVRLRRAGR